MRGLIYKEGAQRPGYTFFTVVFLLIGFLGVCVRSPTTLCMGGVVSSYLVYCMSFESMREDQESGWRRRELTLPATPAELVLCHAVLPLSVTGILLLMGIVLVLLPDKGDIIESPASAILTFTAQTVVSLLLMAFILSRYTSHKNTGESVERWLTFILFLPIVVLDFSPLDSIPAADRQLRPIIFACGAAIVTAAVILAVVVRYRIRQLSSPGTKAGPAAFQYTPAIPAQPAALRSDLGAPRHKHSPLFALMLEKWYQTGRSDTIYSTIAAGLLLIFGAISISMKGEYSPALAILIMIPLLGTITCSVAAIRSVCDDPWWRFQSALPVKRSTLVLSVYLPQILMAAAFLLLLVIELILFLITGFTDISGFTASASAALMFAAIACGLFNAAFMNPLRIRYRSRIGLAFAAFVLLSIEMLIFFPSTDTPWSFSLRSAVMLLALSALAFGASGVLCLKTFRYPEDPLEEDQ